MATQPVFLPEESQGRGSLVGCCLWGPTESDTTEVTQQQQHAARRPSLCSGPRGWALPAEGPCFLLPCMIGNCFTKYYWFFFFLERRNPQNSRFFICMSVIKSRFLKHVFHTYINKSLNKLGERYSFPLQKNII